MTRPHASGDARPGDVMRYQPRLLGLAYRMLGELDDAEDAAQEAYLRWHENDRADICSAEALLVTVVTRISVTHDVQLGQETGPRPHPPRRKGTPTECVQHATA